MKQVISGFNSRRTPQRMEVAAKWMASGLENRGTAEDVVGVRFLQLPLTINNQSISCYAFKPLIAEINEKATMRSPFAFCFLPFALLKSI